MQGRAQVWPGATRCGPGRPTVTRTCGPSLQTASGPGARGPGPVKSGLITLTGLAHAALARRASAFSLSSFCLPQGSRGGTPVAGQALARAGLPGLTILTRYPTRNPSPPTAGAAREGHARLGTRYRSPARLLLGPVWTRLGGVAGDSEPGKWGLGG